MCMAAGAGAPTEDLLHTEAIKLNHQNPKQGTSIYVVRMKHTLEQSQCSVLNANLTHTMCHSCEHVQSNVRVVDKYIHTYAFTEQSPLLAASGLDNMYIFVTSKGHSIKLAMSSATPEQANRTDTSRGSFVILCEST